MEIENSRNKELEKRQGFALLFCTLLFIIIYGGSTYYSENFAEARSIIFDFEKEIPFIPWMILPYMTSGIFFAMVFFWCENATQLKVYTRRFALATVIAGLGFLFFPLMNSFERPALDNHVISGFEKSVEFFDSPYNQAPSLHVTYAILYWTVLRLRFDGIIKWLMGIWLILMIFSTVFVYQHHGIDVITGLILAVFCIILIKENK